MGRRWNESFPVVAILTVLALTLIFGGPMSAAVRFLNFSKLSKDRIASEVQAYVDGLPVGRSGKRAVACLYVVTCDGGTARLALVPDLAQWDLKDAKRDIWRRRSTGFCPGRTTNIGLELAPGSDGPPDERALARWSFFNDRFIPQSGRFQSGAFSDAPWEPCTPERAIIRSPPPVSPRTPPPASAGR